MKNMSRLFTLLLLSNFVAATWIQEASAQRRERGGRGEDNNPPPVRRDERPNRPNPPERRPDRPDRPNPPERRPDRPERPNPPERRPDRPDRPNPPERRPDRPDRPDHRPDRPNPPRDRFDRDRREGRNDEHRRGVIERRRDDVRRDRVVRRDEFERHRYARRSDRDQWRHRYNVIVRRDLNHIRNRDRWYSRYERWMGYHPRPIYVEYPVRWYQPMPQPDYWTYPTVELVAQNLEYLTRDVYTQMAQVAPSNPNQEYAQRLMRTLAELADAAENYSDAVEMNYDYSDTLNDLFYLESMIDVAEQTLAGYSKAYLVQNEMNALRYYVNELLWRYHENY